MVISATRPDTTLPVSVVDWEFASVCLSVCCLSLPYWESQLRFFSCQDVVTIGRFGSLFLSLSRSLSLSVCLSGCLSVCLSVCMSLSVCVCPRSLPYPSIFLFVQTHCPLISARKYTHTHTHLCVVTLQQIYGSDLVPGEAGRSLC